MDCSVSITAHISGPVGIFISSTTHFHESIYGGSFFLCVCVCVCVCVCGEGGCIL